MSEPQKYTEADRVHWEVRKLEAEAQDLLRSPLLKPNFWFSAVPALVAVAGIGFQYFASSLDYKKADVLREQAKLEVSQARLQLEQIQRQVDAKKAELDELKKTAQELQSVQAEKDRMIANIQASLEDFKDGIPATPGPQITRIREAFRSLKGQQTKAESLVKKQFDSFNRLERKE